MAKSFRDSIVNPAHQFITTTPEPVKKAETRSKRIQVILLPSLYARIQQASYSEGLSVNEIIHRTLSQAFPPSEQ